MHFQDNKQTTNLPFLISPSRQVLSTSIRTASNCPSTQNAVVDHSPPPWSRVVDRPRWYVAIPGVGSWWHRGRWFRRSSSSWHIQFFSYWTTTVKQSTAVRLWYAYEKQSERYQCRCQQQQCQSKQQHASPSQWQRWCSRRCRANSNPCGNNIQCTIASPSDFSLGYHHQPFQWLATAKQHISTRFEQQTNHNFLPAHSMIILPNSIGTSSSPPASFHDLNSPALRIRHGILPGIHK